MTKLSKKILALIMALAMVVTMLPLNAILAFAADAALTPGNGVTFEYLTGSTAKNVSGNATWDSSMNAWKFEGSQYMKIDGAPLKGVTTSDGYAISFDVYNTNSGLNNKYFNFFNGSKRITMDGSSSDWWVRYRTEISDENNTRGYYSSDLNNTAYCNPVASANGNDSYPTNEWYTMTVSMNTDGSYSYYRNGELLGTYVSNYISTANGGGLTDDAAAAAVSGATQYIIGASDTTGANGFTGYIKNFKIIKGLTDNSVGKLALLIERYEAKMSTGTVYTNMKAAYEAYVAANKAFDAVVYGGADADTAGIATAYSNLETAMNNMAVWTKQSGKSYNKGFSGDSENLPEAYNNLLWLDTSYNNASRGEGSGSDYTSTNLYYPEATMIYDGDSANASTLAVIIKLRANKSWSTSSKTRYALTAFFTNSNLSLGKSTWGGQIGGNWDATWGINTGGTKFNAASTNSEFSTSNTWKGLDGRSGDNSVYYANYIKYAGVMGNNTAYEEIKPALKVYWNSSNSWKTDDGENNSLTGSTAIHVINYARLVNTIDEYRSDISDISDYKEGGAFNFLNAFDALTSFDVNSYFTSSNNWNGCQSAITTAINGMKDNATLIADSEDYQKLRDVIDMTGTPEEGTAIALRDAYTGTANTKGYGADTYSVFSAEYERAQAAFNNVLTNGYVANYDSKTIAKIASDLEAAFLALDSAQGVAPTVTGNSLLNTTDVVTITNKDAAADDNKVYYEITYDNGKTKKGELTLALDESDSTVAPFSYDEAAGANTATVRAWVKLDGKNSPSGSLDVTLYKAPTGTPTVLNKNDTIDLSSQNGANKGTIYYNYDGSGNWITYSAAFAPFADTGAAARTIYVKETGNGVESSVSTIGVVREGSLVAFADPTPEFGSDYYNKASTIKLADADTYDVIKYQVQEDTDSDFGREQEYNKDGFSASKYENNSFITIKAWAEGAEEQATVTTLYNEDRYNPLAYRESFDSTTANGTELTSSNDDELTVDGTASGTISIESGAGTKSASGTESHSWRNNVLKINANSTAPGPVVTLDKNPLNQSSNKAAAQKNGVTIAFWRHIEDTNGNTVSLPSTGDSTGYPWRNAIAFQKKNDNTNYYIIEVNGVNSRAADTSNYLDVVPENQDNTQHEEGNNNGEWEHVAVTIDPTYGIHVYTNGVEHDYKYATGKGEFADGNTAEAAQKILAFLADKDTRFTFDNGVRWEGNEYNLFLDDIRLYTKPLTQVQINNMYIDDLADVQTNTTSTSHDPTSVTVYTLTGGKKVGVEYIEKNNISDSEIAAIDYYSFGTGMTIYHATDDTQTRWEVLGDSEGRCGYQNQDLFYKDGAPADYTVALADVVTAAGFTDDEKSQGAGHLVWAPHVMYNLDRDCWVYYASMSSWGKLHSATFMATSDDPIKGYTYNSIVYQSNSHTPNSIDFASFYNADYTKLYFVMGSWNWNWYTEESGDNCIYGMELNIDGTAKYPALDSMYTNGQMIASCYRSSYEGGGESDGAGEGAYVQYIDGYYYLFVSYGTNAGSYTERVFRSEEPLGPYVGYNGISSTSTSTGHHGNQILAPFDIDLYDHVYRSTGHNSIYKVKNNNGEWVYVNAVHGRPYASNTHNWIAVPDNALAKRQSGDVTGNVTLNNMVAINEDGWLVMFPNQYNGTDSYSSKLTAKDIQGIYTASDMRLKVDSDWGKEYSYTMLADDVYDDRGVALGNKDGIQFTSKFKLTYDETKKVQYITIYTTSDVDLSKSDAELENYVRYKGVVGTHTGKDKYGNPILIPMLGMINEYKGTDSPHVNYVGEQSWAYRSGNVPDAAEAVSKVDAVALDGVIYTHASDIQEAAVAANHGVSAEQVAKASYALYGQEIADNFHYGDGKTNAERYTTLTVAYPNKIDLTNPSAIYCYSDDARTKTGGYTGSAIQAVPLNKETGGFKVLTNSADEYDDTNQYWYDTATGNTVSEAEIEAMSDEAKKNVVRYYGLRGYVSDYFKYNNDTKKYTEDGVELIITYVSTADVTIDGVTLTEGEEQQEFEFAYVMPNPAWAHTLVAMKNNASNLLNNRNHSFGTFNRFEDSWGAATELDSSMIRYAASGGQNDQLVEGWGYGVSGYLSDFGLLQDSDNKKENYKDLSTLSAINTLFNFSYENEGVNSGSFSARAHDDENQNAYAAVSQVVDTQYYVDYSNKKLYENGGTGLITVQKDNDGKVVTDKNGDAIPTGYTFNMKTSNFLWANYENASIMDVTSYAKNDTGLKISYSSTEASPIQSKTPGQPGTDAHTDFPYGGIYNTNYDGFQVYTLNKSWYNKYYRDDAMLFFTDERNGTLTSSTAYFSTNYRNKLLYYFSSGSNYAMAPLKSDPEGSGYMDGTDSNGTPSSVYNYTNNTAYNTSSNGKLNTNEWQGVATFTGKERVTPNTLESLAEKYPTTNSGIHSELDANGNIRLYDGYYYYRSVNDSNREYWTSDLATAKSSSNYGKLDVTAENYANYILEMGNYHKSGNIGLRGGRLCGSENYHYYNIGVATCDKGAIRQFAQEVLNKDIIIDPETGAISVDGIIDNAKVSFKSYEDYIDAIARCMWFVEDPTKTTFGDLKDEEQYASVYEKAKEAYIADLPQGTEFDEAVFDATEFKTGYGTDGKALYLKDEEGRNIFQDGTTDNKTDYVQAQLVQDVIEAYDNLYDVNKYVAVEDEFKKTEDFFNTAVAYEAANPGTYSAQSLTNYQEALEAIRENAVNYYVYNDTSYGPHKDTYNPETDEYTNTTYEAKDKDGNPILDENGEPIVYNIIDTPSSVSEEFWRKTALTGEEYENLKDYMKELRGSLVEPVDVTPLTSQLNNAVVPQFDENGSPVYNADGTLATDEVESGLSKKATDELGIFDENGNQIYTYTSWENLDNAIYAEDSDYDYAAYEADLSTSRAVETARREASADELVEKDNAINISTETTGSSKYAVLGERQLNTILNLPQEEGDKIYKYEIQLDTSDADSPYFSRDQLAINKKAAILAPLTLETVDTVEAYNTYNNAYTVASGVDLDRYTNAAINPETGKNYIVDQLDRRPEAYIEVTQAIADNYNNRVNGDGKTRLTVADGRNGELRIQPEGMMDPMTAAILEAINTLEGDKETYVKKFKATLTVTKTDANGQTQNLKIAEPLTAFYGEIFTFSVPGLTETTTDAEGNETTVKNAVTYSVTTKDGLAADFDSADATGSQKWTYDGDTIQRIADSNIEISAKIVQDRVTSDIPVKFYNIYNRLVTTLYVPAASLSDITVDGRKVSYNGSDIYIAEDVPFYNFDKFDIKETKDGETVKAVDYTAKYTASPQITFTLPTGAKISGDTNTVDYDTKVTLTQSVDGFKAWAVKTTDGKYAIASYNSSYSFYAIANTEFAFLTESDGKYYIAGNELTEENIDTYISGTVGEFADNTGTQNYPYGKLQFFTDKVTKGLPFITLIDAKIGTDNTVTADGKYHSVLYGLVTDGAKDKVKNVSVILKLSVGAEEKNPITARVTNIDQNGQFIVTVKTAGQLSAYKATGILNYNFDYSDNSITLTINAKDTTIELVK